MFDLDALRRIAMDADLIDEINRLQGVYNEHGLQVFQYACIDGWETVQRYRARSPLFQSCTPTGAEGSRPDGKLCGCLTEIKGEQYPTGPRVAWTDQWTETIRADDRIPWTMGLLRPENLLAFGEWQQTFRDYFRAEGLAEPQPDYVELSLRWP